MIILCQACDVTEANVHFLDTLDELERLIVDQ